MDEFLFCHHLEQCDFRVEKTSYLEIFNYSVGPSSLLTAGSCPMSRKGHI